MFIPKTDKPSPSANKASCARAATWCPQDTTNDGYDNDPDSTARAVDSEGWLHSGDLASMSDAEQDGNVRITGRAKEMIIRGGENIYPQEIEEFLHAHPKIADVYVVGLPDERLGERVLVWVQLKAGESSSEDEISSSAKAKSPTSKSPNSSASSTSSP